MSMFQGPTIVTGMPVSAKNQLVVIRVIGPGEDRETKLQRQRNYRNYLARKAADQRRTAGGRWAK